MDQEPPESARHAARLGVPDAGPAMTMASLLWKAGSELSSYMSAAWTTPDLRAGEADVLMALRLRDDVMTTPADLKAQFNLTSAGITSRLDHLETKELLERRPHPSDRRSVTLHLTSAGERIADETIVAIATTMHELTSGAFTEDELAEVSNQLRALIELLRRKATDAG